MNLIEADAKQILENAGLATPSGRRLLEPGESTPPSIPVAIKAQLLAGGRGKAGLVRLARLGGFAEALTGVRSAMAAGGHVGPIMIESLVDIASEHFLAWRIDEPNCAYVLMYSPHGGIEVESHADALNEEHFPAGRPVRLEAIARFLARCGVNGKSLGAIARFALELHRVLVIEDAVLIEINPLAVTGAGAAVALDAKMTLDDNAAPRHLGRNDLASAGLRRDGGDPIEVEADAAGITFVRLDGTVALVTGGAGIGMTLVDMLGDVGLGAANFVDVPGGSGATIFGDLTRLALRRAAEPDVKAIIIFLTLSATSIKAPVESILATLDAHPPSCPVVVGLVAGGSAEREMTLASARESFSARGYTCVDDIDTAVAQITQLTL
jgi:succinyl-CoA synthetase beta subunit